MPWKSRVEVALNVSYPIFDMAARSGPTSLRECVQSYVFDPSHTTRSLCQAAESLTLSTMYELR